MYVSTSLRQYVKQKRKREETETETETYSYASIGDVDDSGLSVCIAGSLSLSDGPTWTPPRALYGAL